MAETLVHAQQKSGRDAQLVTIIDSDLRSKPLSSPLHTLAAGVDHYIVKHPGFQAPISLLRDQLGRNLSSHTNASDVLHLHGYNGALRLEQLVELAQGKRVVWTLHDMNPFTGTCHYSLGCDRFRDSCSSCPAVRPVFQPLVKKSLETKKAIVSRIHDLRVVAPSEWLAKEARNSAVFADQHIAVIPNPVATMADDPTQDSPPKAHTSEHEGLRVCVIAKNLSDPVKNVKAAVTAFRSFAEHHPDASLRLIGSGGEEFRGSGIELVGPLGSHGVSQELAHSDVLVVASLAENAPLVIIEAAAEGCPSVVSDVGGMPAMVASLQHGSVFRTVEELTTQLTTLAAQNLAVRNKQRTALRAKAHQLYGTEAVVAQYDEQYG